MVESFNVHQRPQKIVRHLALLVGQGIIGTSVQQTSHHFQMTPLRSNEERCIPPAVATVHLLGRSWQLLRGNIWRCAVRWRNTFRSLVNRLMDYLLYLVDIPFILSIHMIFSTVYLDILYIQWMLSYEWNLLSDIYHSYYHLGKFGYTIHKSIFIYTIHSYGHLLVISTYI